MLISPLQTAMRSAMKGAFGGYGQTAVTRDFTYLNAANSQYYNLPSVMSLSGNFAISVLVYYPTAVINIVCGYLATPGDFIVVRANGQIGVKIENTGIDSAIGVFDRAKLNRIQIIKSGTSVTVSLNDAAVAAGTASGAFRFSKIGSWNPLIYHSTGIIADFNVWSGTADVLSAPTHSWAIDSDGSGAIEPATIGGIDLTRVNLTSADTSVYQLNESTDPDQWEQQPSGLVIPVGYSA